MTASAPPPPVRDDRDRVALTSVPMFDRMTPEGVVWADGKVAKVDAIIWCTGFRASLDYLAGLALVGANGKVAVSREGQALAEPRLWFLGYGGWTGFASATLIGCGRMARETVRAISSR
jgi:putative flavoprotein involved in K+ transport